MTRASLRHLAPAWTLIGVGALFTSAVTRLGSRGVSTLSDGLSPGQWVVLVLFTSVMVYGEGVLAHEMTEVLLVERGCHNTQPDAVDGEEDCGGQAVELDPGHVSLGSV